MNEDLPDAASGLEQELVREIAVGENPEHPLRVWLRGVRERVDRNRHLNFLYRVFIALVGGVIVLAGIIMLVTPGPGWLTIFLGLAVLSTEFHWAKRLSDYTKRQLMRFWSWWRSRRWRRARRIAQRRIRRAKAS